MMEITILFLVVMIPFLLGSIPTGYLLTRAAGLGDIRTVGSGNIGATNVLRTGKKSLALLTLLGDAGKGALAVYLGYYLDSTAQTIFLPYLFGILALLGHMYTPWLHFKGGKGVATAAGILIALVPMVAGMALVTWLMVAVIFRYSSLAAIVTALLVPFYTYLWYPDQVIFRVVPIAVMMLLVLNRHRSNMARLLAGTEDRIGADKNKLV